jgi:hypothetical protein
MNIAPHTPFPAPFNLPADRRPEPYNLPLNQRPGRYTNKQTDIDRLFTAFEQIPALGAPGFLHCLEGPGAAAKLPSGLGQFHLVEKDTIAAVVAQNGETLCAAGVNAESMILTARGTSAQGHMVLAMAYWCASCTPVEVLAAMRTTMTRMGVSQYTTMAVGGGLSRVLGYPMIPRAIGFVAAAHQDESAKLACARIGVTQTEQHVAYQAQGWGLATLPPWPGVPAGAICAVFTTQGLVYAVEDECGPTLFPKALTVPAGGTPTAAIPRAVILPAVTTKKVAVGKGAVPASALAKR